MKAKKLMFNGDIHEIGVDLHESIQKSLDNALAGAFSVNKVTVDDVNSTVEINISWIPKDYYKELAGCLTLEEAMLFTGKLNKEGQQLPLLRHPFANICHYHFDIDEFIAEYNLVMKRNNKLKGLSVSSSPSQVTFNYKF